MRRVLQTPSRTLSILLAATIALAWGATPDEPELASVVITSPFTTAPYHTIHLILIKASNSDGSLAAPVHPNSVAQDGIAVINAIREPQGIHFETDPTEAFVAIADTELNQKFDTDPPDSYTDPVHHRRCCMKRSTSKHDGS